MKKTNFKEVTHEMEFVFLSDLVWRTIITCGKLIGYEKGRDLLHTYVSLFIFKLKSLFRKNKNMSSQRVICDISIYN